jgi:hypothetical protein
MFCNSFPIFALNVPKLNAYAFNGTMKKSDRKPKNNFILVVK